MEPDDVVRLPAGWYPDPTGLPQLRWWDNHAWTQHTTAARQPLIVQEPPLAWADDLPTRRERRERERDDRNTSDLTPPTAQSLLELDPPDDDVEPVDEPAPAALEPEDVAPADEVPAEPVHDASTSAPVSAPISTSVDDGEDEEPQPDTNSAQADAEVQFEPRSASGHAGRIPEVPPLEDSASDPYASELPSTQPRMIFTALRGNSATIGTPLFDQIAFGSQPGTSAPTLSIPPTQQSIGHPGQNNNGMLSVPTSTAPVWIIALFPLFQLVIMLLLVTGFGATIQLDLVIPILLGAIYVTMIALAFADYRILKHSGIAKPAHWTWSLLTSLVYLFVRATVLTRKTGRGFGPVLVWIALSLLSVVSVVAVPGMLITTVPGVFSTQAEQSVTADAAANGATLEVHCPAAPPVLIGQTFSCVGTSGPSKHYDIEVSLQRSNGWIDWRVDDWGINTLSR